MIHGFWHAGNYDKNDFLGRLINSQWVKTFEKSLAQAIDYNWFASDYHLNMFRKNFGYKEIELFRTGWPMEYLNDMFEPKPKENIILFPHRIAPEKQPEIFRDLKESMPEYEFVICQEQELNKNEYHNLLGEAKMVFSANLQETLGISWYEGCLVDTMPLVPNRLSYSEMAIPEFAYPSIWTGAPSQRLQGALRAPGKSRAQRETHIMLNVLHRASGLVRVLATDGEESASGTRSRA